MNDLYADPFRFTGEIVNPGQRSMFPIPKYETLDPLDRAVIVELGRRGSRMISDVATKYPPGEIIAPHHSIAACAIATVHLQRPLDLQAFMQCDDLTFIHEFTQIMRHLNQRTFHFPPDVKLKFLKKNA